MRTRSVLYTSEYMPSKGKEKGRQAFIVALNLWALFLFQIFTRRFTFSDSFSSVPLGCEILTEGRLPGMSHFIAVRVRNG